MQVPLQSLSKSHFFHRNMRTMQDLHRKLMEEKFGYTELRKMQRLLRYLYEDMKEWR